MLGYRCGKDHAQFVMWLLYSSWLQSRGSYLTDILFGFLFNYFILTFIYYLCVYTCTHICSVELHATEHTWRKENNFVEYVLSYHYLS